MNIKKHLPWLGALLPVASMQADKTQCGRHLCR
ncbi:N-acetylgalactosamine-6-sulfatase [Bacteroides ovatus]|nr:N-acetylgalactosamine-6-sulfatase [Bacteroides ovatus]